MAILSIIQLHKENLNCGGSCLRTEATEVKKDEFGSKWLKRFIADMFETLYSCSSGVGLAANQVGVLKKICVIDIKRDAKKPLVLINPSYKPVTEDKVQSYEMCLSFPEVASTVMRNKKITISYQDFYGNNGFFEAEGFKAMVFQHEIDHLNGIVHVDLNCNSSELDAYEGYCVKMSEIAVNNILKEE